MKLKFKIQQYQTDAVENVVRVFDGQPNLGLLEYKIDHGKVYVEQGGKRMDVKEFEYDEEDTGYKNGDIVLDEEMLLKNIHHIQTESNIHLSCGKETRSLSARRGDGDWYGKDLRLYQDPL